jgi:PilZ domain
MSEGGDADEVRARAEVRADADKDRHYDRRAGDHAESDAAGKLSPGKDRRRSTRFNCGGDARISVLPSDGIFLPGKILDLSLHGCRVDVPLPVECGARAEIILRVNAATIRAVGEVRELRSGSGAGIEFVQLSAGGKDMLADLVRELARLQAVMDKLRAERREADAESLLRQLEEGQFRVGSWEKRFGGRGTVLSAGRAEKDSGSKAEAADKDRIVEGQRLVVPVDLFG